MNLIRNKKFIHEYRFDFHAQRIPTLPTTSEGNEQRMHKLKGSVMAGVTLKP